MKSYKYWAEDEIDKILREYKEKDTEVLAKELGRSKGSIATKYYDTIKQRGIELKKKQKITNKNYGKVMQVFIRKYCFRCKSEMVVAELINTWGQVFTALVCPECGRFYSKYREFRGK